MSSTEEPPGAGPDAGRPIPDPGFAGDDGSADPRLAAALAAYAAGRLAFPEALAVLQASRLLVPVIAVLGEVEHDDLGRAREKSSDMATVLMRGADGRLALLAFSGLPALAGWDPGARPVPVAATAAAQAALQDGAEALVVDVAGPATLVVEGDDLRGLAAGWTIARMGETTVWIGPAGESSDSISR